MHILLLISIAGLFFLPVPVFVVYLTAGIGVEGRLAWYKDVYRLNVRSVGK